MTITRLPIRITLDLVVLVDDHIVYPTATETPTKTAKATIKSAGRLPGPLIAADDIAPLTPEEELAIAQRHSEIAKQYPTTKRKSVAAATDSTMANDLVVVLDRLGGRDSFLAIFDGIHKMRKASNRPLPKSLRNNVRSELSRNSAASNTFHGRDLFRKIKRGSGAGRFFDNELAVWALTPEGVRLAAQIRQARPTDNHPAPAKAALNRSAT